MINNKKLEYLKIKLAKAIKKESVSLNKLYTSRLKKDGGNSYQKIPEEELSKDTSRVIEAHIAILERNDWSIIEEFSDYITVKFEEGFSSKEIYQIFTTSGVVLKTFIKDGFYPEEACELISILWEQVEKIYEFADKKLDELASERYQEKMLHLTTIYKTSIACSSTIRLEEIAATAFNKLKEFLPMESFYLAIFKEDTNTLNFDYIVDQGNVLPSFSRKLEEGVETISTWVLKNKTPLLIRDLEKETLPTGIVLVGTPPNPRSILIVPLILKNKPLGIISLQAFSPNAYDEKILELIKMIANNLALAIDNAFLYENTYESSITDYLTGLYNRLHFTNILNLEINRSNRYKTKFTLLMGDVDDFKIYNDNLGYLKGDEILKEISNVLKENVRSSDIVFRFGGDEFVILLPSNERESARPLIKRIKEGLSRMSPLVSMTWSVLCYPEDAPDKDVLISMADTILKEGKRMRNHNLLEPPPLK